MKRSIMLLSVLAGLSAMPAAADPFSNGDSYGPRAPSGATVSPGVPDVTAFSPVPHSTSVALSVGATQAEIDAQVKANVAAGRASYEAIARAGGCNAEILPVTIAAYCWDKGSGTDEANPTGGPVGASMGGSDGGDGASE